MSSAHHRSLPAVADVWLFTTTLLLVTFGVIMVYSASSVIAAEKFGDHRYFLIRQAIYAVVGVAAMMAMMRINYRIYQKPWVVYSLLLICIGLLVGVLFAPSVNQAHRWYRWKWLSFQPAEAAKLVLIVFVAYYLSKRLPHDTVLFSRTVAPCAGVAAVLIGLVVIEPDLGMAVALGCILVTALFVAGVPWRHLLWLAVAALPALYYLLFRVSWRLERLLVFLDPWRDPQGRGFQTIQSMTAIGSGGVWGAGLAQGKQKLFYLPEPHTDFVFAHIGEELGMIGLTMLVGAYTIVLWRGIRAALRAPDSFGMLLGVCITVALVGQALFNMSVTLGLAPVKGLPLPLVSYGGSSLVLTLAQIGILLNIAQASGGTRVA
ncbi:MAG: putative lipid II flippase FtsW [Acidobacteriota bacterium]|nr:putative lipid II flippase FtsW [Acidobacteriota bacterium]